MFKIFPANQENDHDPIFTLFPFLFTARDLTAALLLALRVQGL